MAPPSAPGSASSTPAAASPLTARVAPAPRSASPASTAVTLGVAGHRAAGDHLPDRRHQPQGDPLGGRPAHRAASRIRLGQDQGHSTSARLPRRQRLPGLQRRHLRRRRRRHRHRQGSPVALLRARPPSPGTAAWRSASPPTRGRRRSATRSSTRSRSTTSALNPDNVIVKDTLPSGVTFISASPAQNTGPNPLVWNVGTLQPGQKFEAGHRQGHRHGASSNTWYVTSDELPPPQDLRRYRRRALPT